MKICNNVILILVKLLIDICALVGIILIDILREYKYGLLLFLVSLWIPQIIHNAMYSIRRGPQISYIILLTFEHISVPVILTILIILIDLFPCHAL